MKHLSVLRRGIGLMGLVLAVSLAMLALTSSAYATAHHPTGEYAVFNECPSE